MSWLLTCAGVQVTAEQSFLSFCACSGQCSYISCSQVRSASPPFGSMADPMLSPLDPTRTALVLIEFQNDNDMLNNSARLLQEARKLGVVVLHVPIKFGNEYREVGPQPYGILAGIKEARAFLEGGEGAHFFEGMTPLPEETIIKGKRGLDSFASTDLDVTLRRLGIDTIALAGFLTNCCVESTMRTAYDAGFKVFTVTDACAALSEEEHLVAVRYTFPMFSRPLLHTELLAQLASAGRAL